MTKKYSATIIVILSLVFSNCKISKSSSVSVASNFDSGVSYLVQFPNSSKKHDTRFILSKLVYGGSINTIFQVNYNKRVNAINSILLTTSDTFNSPHFYFNYKKNKLRYITYSDSFVKFDSIAYIPILTKSIYQFDNKGKVRGIYLLKDGRLDRILFSEHKYFEEFKFDFQNSLNVKIDSVNYNYRWNNDDK